MTGYGEKAGPVASYPGMKPQACREAGRTMGGMVSVQGGPAVHCMVFFERVSCRSQVTGEVDGLPFWTANPPENPAGSFAVYPFVLKCLCDEIQAKEHDKDIGTAFHGQAETLVSSGFGNADAASCQDNGQTVSQAEQNGHQDAA